MLLPIIYLLLRLRRRDPLFLRDIEHLRPADYLPPRHRRPGQLLAIRVWERLVWPLLRRTMRLLQGRTMPIDEREDSEYDSRAGDDGSILAHFDLDEFIIANRDRSHVPFPDPYTGTEVIIWEATDGWQYAEHVVEEEKNEQETPEAAVTSMEDLN